MPKPGEEVNVKYNELIAFDAKKVHITNDGYLVAEPRIARTGIQIYAGDEVGASDMDKVRVYRPEAEVFHADALTSLAWKPVTLDHPSEMVTSENWRKYGIGQLSGDIARDGEFIRVPLVLMDQQAIDAWRDGKAQLSVGYTAMLKWGEGKTETGEVYDAVQTSIRANHVAVVNSARGGPSLRIGDLEKERTMTQRTINLDGVNVQLDDKDGQILERHLATMRQSTADVQTKLTASETKAGELAAKIVELSKTIEGKDGEIAGLNKKVQDSEITPVKLDGYVRERMDVVSRAQKIVGDTATLDGKTDIQIKREVIEKLMGSEATKAMSDEAIGGAFRALTTPSSATDGVRRISEVFGGARPVHSSMDAAATAYEKRNKELSNAWRGHPEKTA